MSRHTPHHSRNTTLHPSNHPTPYTRTCRYVLYSMSFSVPRCSRPMWGSARSTNSPVWCVMWCGVWYVHECGAQRGGGGREGGTFTCVGAATQRERDSNHQHHSIAHHSIQLCNHQHPHHVPNTNIRTRLTLHLQHQAQHTVSSRVLGAKVDGKVVHLSGCVGHTYMDTHACTHVG